MTLPLDTFREILGFHPFHFWQLVNSVTPITDACNDLVKEQSWQNTDAIGRADIREAIETAERRLSDHLGYNVMPRWGSDTVPFARYFDNAQQRVGYADGQGRWISAQVKDGRVDALGIETLTLIGTVTTGVGGGLVFSDADADGLNDTFVATIATTITDPAQIALYFAAGDRLDGEAAGDRWRIEPVRVSISAGTATIRGRYWLLVKPLLYQGVLSDQLNPLTATNFVASLDVYRRYNNPDGTTLETSQAVLYWETPPYPNCDEVYLPTNASDPAAVAQAIGRAGIRDARNGYLYAAESAYNVTSAQWSAGLVTSWRTPDRVLFRYRSGDALDTNGHMRREWATVVARLAAAEMSRPICGCDKANQELWRWQVDLALNPSGGSDFDISQSDLNNPLGTRLGHLYAWKRINKLALGQGALV